MKLLQRPGHLLLRPPLVAVVEVIVVVVVVLFVDGGRHDDVVRVERRRVRPPVQRRIFGVIWLRRLRLVGQEREVWI